MERQQQVSFDLKPFRPLSISRDGSVIFSIIKFLKCLSNSDTDKYSLSVSVIFNNFRNCPTSENI